MTPAVAVRTIGDPAEVPATVESFVEALTGPTLLRLPGADPTRVRAVSVLLHGNEISGLRAAHAYLRSGARPAVDAAIFVGAVEAAQAPPRFSRRMLPGRRDLNRCFRPPFDGPDGAIAEAALGLLRALPLEATVDLHNNTGDNPVYALGAQLEPRRLALGAMFATRFVRSELRLGTLLEALDDRAPCIVVECGRVGDPAGDAAALAGLRRFLEVDAVEPLVASATPLSVLVDPVRVLVRGDVTLAFADAARADAALTLKADLDRHNFEVVPGGTVIGWLAAGAPWPFLAHDERGEEVSHELLRVVDGALVTERTFVPIMMTTDPRAVAADCLCYVVRTR